ncbi:Protein of unknown function DUF2458 [Penicillium brevicompactum]|uniref:Uncharacterized protein n=1 Tax=Penicillium brevicompactum TaxID=5074 RepID=A0A9W9QFB8_PENBR|nr:Protein of unknown function DUF2458 [Penicillium brevicompactum]
MAEQNYNAADLNSVLQTLSSLAPQAQVSQNTTPAPAPPKRSFSSTNTNAPPGQTQDPRQKHPQPSPSNRPSTSTYGANSSTITTWPIALRHVMRTVGQNEETQIRIRGMIRSQHHHEQSWFDSRQALIKQQQGRPQKQRELDAVLRSIGAPVKEDDGSTEKELAAELKTYDLKVHAAAVKMADALAAELRGMDIPFFTLRKDLVKDAPNAGDSVQSKAGTAAASSSITKPELLDLQNRMLGLLEDLCKE